MTRWLTQKFEVFAACVLLMFSSAVHALEAEIEQQLRTAYLEADFGASTYKSKLQLQNDTGNSMRVTFGANVGTGKDVNIRLIRESSPINFEFNQGSISPVWNQTAITYRLGFFYFGPVLSQVAMEAKRDGEALFTVTGSGYGGATGFLWPLSKSTLLHLDIVAATISQIQEKDQKPITFGPRINADLGGSVDITKRAFDFIFGYRYMKHSITFEETASAELMTTTYLGFATGFDF